MIYNKDANFPYPIFSQKSDSYLNNDFTLSVELDQNSLNYKLILDYIIESDFIKELLRNKQAQLVLVIQSRDNRFINIELNQKEIEIPKTRLSLSKRTTIQLLIQSKREINFKYNMDLNSFYSEFKDEIIVPKNSLLGFSNVVIYDGSITKPFEIFEKKVDPSIKSDIKIEIASETIVIVYKSEELQFRSSILSNELNNPYIYMGLQKALFRFIVNNCKDEEEEVNLEEIDVPSNGLDLKLYNLMRRKLINDISFDNIDEVIYAISDKIINKYSNAIRRLHSDGN
ncbi:hypothetical protein [Clostridium butyricum]|uniref:hypothetical protein n=1 Tax=Clostridium butyricum TaxID=1492 RepID=UPI0034651C5B